MASWLSHSSAIRRAFEHAHELAAEVGEENVFDFSIGNPGAPCPAGVRTSLGRAARDTTPGIHGYMDSAGFADVRECVATNCRDRFDIPYEASDIVMTTGAACAINMALLSVLDPGDEVIVFKPYYAGYFAFARNWDLNLVEVDFNPETLLPDLEDLTNKISPHTKMVIVNTPNNPTGVVYPLDFARQLAGVLARRAGDCGTTIYLLSDEPYRELVFDGLTNPYWPDYYHNTMVAYSFSKSLSIPGDRIGYLALTPGMEAHDDIRAGVCQAMGNLGFVNAPATAQRIVLDCIDESVDLDFYDQNRKLLYGALVEAGFSPIRPQGAFYIFVPVPDGEEGRFIELAARHHVFVVEGSDFGAPGFIRFSFCIPREKIAGARPYLRELGREYATV